MNCNTTHYRANSSSVPGDPTLTLDQVEAMLLETAVDKARGNLSSAARMLGLTRPQIAYRLKRLHEGKEGADDFGPASPPPTHAGAG